MSQQEIVITNDSKVQLPEAETDYLQSFLDVGDRGGFYLAYYNMTGSAQALEQAKKEKCHKKSVKSCNHVH